MGVPAVWTVMQWLVTLLWRLDWTVIVERPANASSRWPLWTHKLMALDQTRNRAYAEALVRAGVRGARVLDLGAGPYAVLSKLAVEAGASTVHAVELDTRWAARAQARVAGARRPGSGVSVECGSSYDVAVESPDVIVFDMMGSIASAEGVVDVLRDVQRRLPVGVAPRYVPYAARTLIGPARLPTQRWYERAASRLLSAGNADPDGERALDLRVYGRPTVYAVHEMESFYFASPPNDCRSVRSYAFVDRDEPILCDGLAAYLEFEVAPDGPRLDTLATRTNWPVRFIRLYEPAVDLFGCTVTVRTHAEYREPRAVRVANGNVLPRYEIEVTITGRDGGPVRVDTVTWAGDDAPARRTTGAGS